MPTRVAIIGLGAAARTIHLPAYAELGTAVEVVAATEIDPTRRKLDDSRWRRVELYDDAATMLERTQPDVVTICSPPARHREHVLLALSRGAHVFCEKPLTENLGDCDAIIAAAAAADRSIVVNTQFPCMRIHQAAKAQIGTPQFGRLTFMHAWQSFLASDSTEAGWRGDLRRRVCLEFGIHVLALVRFFFDATPRRIYCHMPTNGSATAAESVDIMSIEFADGRAASVVLDRLSKGPHRYLDLTLDGEHATIQTSLGGEMRLELGLHTRERKPFWQLHVAKGGKAVRYNGNRATALASEGLNPFASATAAHFAQFLDAMAAQQTPAVTAADHRTTLGMALAAYESAETGQPVDLQSYLATQ